MTTYDSAELMTTGVKPTDSRQPILTNGDPCSGAELRALPWVAREATDWLYDDFRRIRKHRAFRVGFAHDRGSEYGQSAEHFQDK